MNDQASITLPDGTVLSGEDLPDFLWGSMRVKGITVKALPDDEWLVELKYETELELGEEPKMAGEAAPLIGQEPPEVVLQHHYIDGYGANKMTIKDVTMSGYSAPITKDATRKVTVKFVTPVPVDSLGALLANVGPLCGRDVLLTGRVVRIQQQLPMADAAQKTPGWHVN